MGNFYMVTAAAGAAALAGWAVWLALHASVRGE